MNTLAFQGTFLRGGGGGVGGDDKTKLDKKHKRKDEKRNIGDYYFDYNCKNAAKQVNCFL